MSASSQLGLLSYSQTAFPQMQSGFVDQLALMLYRVVQSTNVA